jgi:site-specific DNA-methyltransferase (adenine-specific)|tara:strand:+ start:1140 stop:1847 length:708 start_codon:yes stop_codon:yes gene_type:complete
MKDGIKLIPDNSIQLILTDLPYGKTEIDWDKRIDMKKLWSDWWRVLKDNGSIILYGVQPFSSYLVNSQLKYFKYSLVWKKSRVGGFAQAPYRFLNEHEDLLVFSKAGMTKNSKNRILYNPQGIISCNKKMKGKGSNGLRANRKTQKDYVQKNTNYPRSILNFKNLGKVYHPTQKPVQLNEYLINSFTNKNDFVLDTCFGSGSTIVASKNTDRNFVGFELDKSYFDNFQKRITNWS